MATYQQGNPNPVDQFEYEIRWQTELTSSSRDLISSITPTNPPTLSPTAQHLPPSNAALPAYSYGGGSATMTYSTASSITTQPPPPEYRGRFLVPAAGGRVFDSLEPSPNSSQIPLFPDGQHIQSQSGFLVSESSVSARSPQAPNQHSRRRISTSPPTTQHSTLSHDPAATGPSYLCSLCGTRFPRKADLKRHQLTSCRNNPVQAARLRCKNYPFGCKGTFKRKDAQSVHEKDRCKYQPP